MDHVNAMLFLILKIVKSSKTDKCLKQLTITELHKRIKRHIGLKFFLAVWIEYSYEKRNIVAMASGDHSVTHFHITLGCILVSCCTVTKLPFHLYFDKCVMSQMFLGSHYLILDKLHLDSKVKKRGLHL
jgi:hypothetical protein